MENNSLLKLELKDKKKTIGLIHKVYITQLKKKYNHTASTKTKSEVRGGGRKPWKQKGTGNARAGSRRSPLWVGGGVTFGPKPYKVNKKINKKEKRLALFSAFYLKRESCKFISNDIFEQFENIKTKKVLEILKNLEIKENSKILFVLTKMNNKFWLSARNIKNVKVITADCLNLENILKTNYIILSNTAFESINLNYGKSYK